MPDGDIIHNRLARLYQKPYKFLCEGKASPSECARATVKALKQGCSKVENLSVVDMQSCLLQLYQRYIAEWDDVESQLSVGLLNTGDQRSSSKRWSVA